MLKLTLLLLLWQGLKEEQVVKGHDPQVRVNGALQSPLSHADEAKDGGKAVTNEGAIGGTTKGKEKAENEENVGNGKEVNEGAEEAGGRELQKDRRRVVVEKGVEAGAKGVRGLEGSNGR